MNGKRERTQELVKELGLEGSSRESGAVLQQVVDKAGVEPSGVNGTGVPGGALAQGCCDFGEEDALDLQERCRWCGVAQLRRWNAEQVERWYVAVASVNEC